MSKKNVVHAFPMLLNEDASTSFQSPHTNITNLDKASIHVTWTGSPIGELRIQAAQKKAGEIVKASDWFDLDFGATIAINALDTNHQIILNELPFTTIRLSYISTSGTGTISATITAKQVGA